MEGRKRIAVVGSDARQAAAGRALARAGYAVAGAEQVARADVILLPLPLDESRTPLAQLLRAGKPGAFALGVQPRDILSHLRAFGKCFFEKTQIFFFYLLRFISREIFCAECTIGWQFFLWKTPLRG